MTIKLGLTGGIGAGKSFIAQLFHRFNIPIFYSDLIAKEIMVANDQVVSEIKILLGADAYQNGLINRSFIAQQVFSNKALLHELNMIVHPKVFESAQNWFKLQTGPYAIQESALIFETNLYQHLDKVISVSASRELRIKRVMERDNVSKEAVLKRMDNQLSQEEKDHAADFIILNDGSKSLIRQVFEIHKLFSK